MRSLLALLAAALVGAAAVAIVAPRDGAQAAGNATTTLKVGDRVQVEGQPIGCRVAHQDSAVVVDCRHAGALAGTYGTMISSRKAEVVRFRSDTVAKVAFTATHHGTTHRCK
jgi:hypothetical protein